ncbi:MAG TPA: alpha-L-fucosidase [Vicinamibacterales bacterium]
MNRRVFLRAGAAAVSAGWLRHSRQAADRPRPRPSAAQLAWQRDELAIFIHFGINTFTDREWGDGREDPAIFAPARLDARQWARAARAGGFRAMVLTAKHHDGFCLWPSRTTPHTVARSPFRSGAGDVVREFVDACRAERLRPGLYLSPWDRNSPVYGDSPRYNDLYCEQLTELLTNYGPLAEVWFDGANGEGPNGRKQEYDWPRVWALVRKLQPNAVMFSDAGPDVRWCGNERGSAGDPNWSTVDPAAVPYPGISGTGVIAALQHGDPAGTVWRPAEADTSIRPGWFYHPAEDARVQSVDSIVQLYFRSVGRNAKLLLNVPPTRDGLLHDTDVARLAEVRSRLTALFERDLASGRRMAWTRTGERTATAEVDLGRSVPASIVRLAEQIENGQTIGRYSVRGSEDGTNWRELSKGTTIGYARLDRFEPATIRRVRVVIEEAVETPQPIRVKVFS